MKNVKGFSLAEVMVAMAIGMLMLMVVYTAVNMGQKSSAGIEGKVAAQQDARAALDLMAMELRMASYNPTLAPSIWVNPTSCSGASASSTYRGITAATASSISVEMDLNGNGVIGDASNEIITYAYDPANGYITRSTNCGGAQPFLGDKAANEDKRTVLVVNDDAGAPVFRYYDGAFSGAGVGTEIPAASLPGRIPDIRRIEITLVVDTHDQDPHTGSRRRLVYSTSVIPRNHAVTYTN
ncbi:MAG: prepilin-type N-terminal cleavage/methylation domain-containing protein [Pseudomonadota bacterium]|nr:prepilin-type N-terminal cleavage/methylation domain-containing protein [Pseudomonadota bacterium]